MHACCGFVFFCCFGSLRVAVVVEVEVEVVVVGLRFLRESSFQGSLLYLSREESLGNHFFEIIQKN